MEKQSIEELKQLQLQFGSNTDPATWITTNKTKVININLFYMRISDCVKTSRQLYEKTIKSKKLSR